MQQIKILLLTQWFEPEPALKGLSFAKELTRRGHSVEVLTGFPNYPGGRIYDGYAIRVLHRETMDGIPVTRVPLYPNHDRSAPKRALNYLTFAAAASSIGIAATRRPDIAYVYHPPASVAIPAAMLRLSKRVPFVLDIQDMWPDTLRATGMLRNRPALLGVTHACQIAYRVASRIAVLSPGFKKLLVDRGVAADKVKVIYNWTFEEPPLSSGNDDARLHSAPGVFAEHFNVVFAGTMGPAQGLSSVLHAARIVMYRDKSVRFVFVGGGIEAEPLRREAAELALDNVVFLGVRPPSEMRPLLTNASVLLVHLKNDPLFEVTIPSKTQAYMAAGRPILMAVRGDAATLVLQSHAGVCAEPGNPESIAQAVLAMSALHPTRLLEMGDHGRKYYQKHLSLERGAAEFESVFCETLAKRQKARGDGDGIAS